METTLIQWIPNLTTWCLYIKYSSKGKIIFFLKEITKVYITGLQKIINTFFISKLAGSLNGHITCYLYGQREGVFNTIKSGQRLVTFQGKQSKLYKNCKKFPKNIKPFEGVKNVTVYSFKRASQCYLFSNTDHSFLIFASGYNEPVIAIIAATTVLNFIML